MESLDRELSRVAHIDREAADVEDTEDEDVAAEDDLQLVTAEEDLQLVNGPSTGTRMEEALDRYFGICKKKISF